MKKYKTLIIDDDIENINLLKVYVSKYCPEAEVLGEAKNVNDGVREYLRIKPEILLLDIDLGNETIFNFIDAIDNIKGEIIFISSHTEFGVKAVNYNITGYIVKPIKATELQKIMAKAIFNLETALSNSTSANNKIDFPINIAVPTVNKIELIPVNTIKYLEADGKYTIFHLTDNQEKIASRNLGEYEKIVNPKLFFRIHHRYLVNINMVSNIYKTGGNYCELIDGKALPIAKRRQDLFHKFLRLK